eukprot:3100549-Amphidinium_carterae.1
MACSLTTPVAVGGYQSILLFREPVSLSTKKAAGLAGSFMKCPGVLGVGSSEEAIRIRHQVYDAGVPESCLDVMSGKWASEMTVGPTSAEGIATDLDPERAVLTEWHTYAHCACHAAHNSLKWSLHTAFEDASLVLQPSPVEFLPGEAELAALWATCDLSPEVQQGLVQSRL